ncbi:MAG: hypothetical protein O7C59_10320, partial [Rickettsia endosymbiont of Ixodes persulcatus]|nr:hypothetical protein [Rickettsia endosymbiont of Ixodes persulcatus]
MVDKLKDRNFHFNSFSSVSRHPKQRAQNLRIFISSPSAKLSGQPNRDISTLPTNFPYPLRHEKSTSSSGHLPDAPFKGHKKQRGRKEKQRKPSKGKKESKLKAKLCVASRAISRETGYPIYEQACPEREQKALSINNGYASNHNDQLLLLLLCNDCEVSLLPLQNR